MRDIQEEPSSSPIHIDRVGVRGLALPLAVPTREGALQQTVAEIDVAVDLPRTVRGIHMSRLFEAFAPYRQCLWIDDMTALLDDLKTRLKATTAFAKICFPFFMDKEAPVTGTTAPMAYSCAIGATLSEGETNREAAGPARRATGADVTLEVSVPVTTLCPCSRALAEQGAHNQRGLIRTVVRFSSRPLFIEELVELVEYCGSCGVYSLLKRPDEKYVTEKAYDNPRFVEDVARQVADRLMAEPAVSWFAIEAESFESIHNHNAYAFIKRDKSGPDARDDGVREAGKGRYTHGYGR